MLEHVVGYAFHLVNDVDEICCVCFIELLAHIGKIEFSTFDHGFIRFSTKHATQSADATDPDVDTW